MTSIALAPLPGDPGALSRAAGRLGAVAADVAGDRSAYRAGAATVTVSVMNSGSALRLTELHDGMRGVEAELSAVEAGGGRVARALEQHAADWRRVEDQLEDWRREVTRVERAADLAGADGSSPEATTAHQLARMTKASAEADAREVKQTLAVRRDTLAAAVHDEIWTLDPTWAGISPASIRGAALTAQRSDDPWEQLATAYSFIAADDARQDKAGLGYQLQRGIEGFGQAAESTVSGLAAMVAHPMDAAEGLWSFGADLAIHPVDTSTAAWHQFWDPFAEDWAVGDYGHAIGTGAWDALALAFGTKGLTKVGGLGKAGAFGARARMTAFRALRERHSHLARNAIQVGTTHYLFRSEREAAWALAHPLPDHTYRVEYEGLPTDYVLDSTGRIAAVRGPKTLGRTDIPVVPDKAYRMRDMLAANGWKPVNDFYSGGRFGNMPGAMRDSARLPAYDRQGREITYTEFDVNPFVSKKTRGNERIVRGLDGRVWYTDDHYKTQVELK